MQLLLFEFPFGASGVGALDPLPAGAAGVSGVERQSRSDEDTEAAEHGPLSRCDGDRQNQCPDREDGGGRPRSDRTPLPRVGAPDVVSVSRHRVPRFVHQNSVGSVEATVGTASAVRSRRSS